MGILITICTSCSFIVYQYSHSIATELPFLFFSLLTLLAADRYVSRNKVMDSALFATAVFLLCSYFTRSVGISLLPAVLLGVALKYFKRDIPKDAAIKKIIMLLLLCGVPILLWSLRNYLYRGSANDFYANSLFINPYKSGRPHFAPFEFILNIAQNVYAYIFYAIPEIVTGHHFNHRSIFAFFLTAVVLCGYVFSIKNKKPSMHHWFILFYMGILFIWPWSKVSGVRFIVPVIPFLFYYFLVAIAEFSNKIRKSIMPAISVALILSAVNLGVWLHEYLISRATKNLPNSETRFAEAAQWMKAHTPPDTRVYTFDALIFYLYSERGCFESFSPEDSNQALNSVLQHNLDYVVIDGIFPSNFYIGAKEMLNRFPQLFTCVYANGETKIYHVVKPQLPGKSL